MCCLHDWLIKNLLMISDYVIFCLFKFNSVFKPSVRVCLCVDFLFSSLYNCASFYYCFCLIERYLDLNH